MADNKTVKTKRQLAMERLASKYPDKDFADEEVLFGQIHDDYDDYDKQLDEYRGREESLTKMFAADRRSAVFFTRWRNGEDPAVNLVRMFGTEIKDAIEDPERVEEIAAANKEFLERVTEEAEYEKQYTANLDQTNAYLDELQSSSGMSDDEIDAVMQRIFTIAKDAILGKFAPETIEMVRKAIRYDRDVADAAHEGEIRGRNEKIEEKLRTSQRNDGTATLNGSNNSVNRPRRVESIFDLANQAK